MRSLEDRPVVHDIEIEISTADRQTRNWLFSASTIDIGNDKIILAVANDITERKSVEKSLDETQKQLMQSEKMAALGRFASGLAHEVKNPLGVLLGGVEYIRDKMPDAEPEVREAITKMREAVMRANIVVKDMLSFARPSRLVFEKVHPDSLVRDAIGFAELFRHKSDTAEIEIKQELRSGDIYVEVDKNQMQQALFNILLNSIEAVSMRGEILLRTYSEGANCVIEIKDTGHGIAREDIAKLFEPFFTTKRDRKGTGLGLSIVKSIIERHKGTIVIESEKGKGTSVKIRLPQYSGKTGKEGAA
jgi:two-component system sensor histidine kinase HydH